MSVTTPSTGQKISDFSAGNVDANSYFIQANSGSTSKVSASQIGQFSNLNLLFSGAGGLDTTAKTIVGAINEVNRKEASDITYDNTSSGLNATDVNAAIDEVKAATDSLFLERKYTASNITINAKSRKTLSKTDLDISPIAGYFPLAMKGINTLSSAGLAVQGFNPGGSQLVVSLYNTTDSAITASPEVAIIYVKEEFVGT